MRVSFVPSVCLSMEEGPSPKFLESFVSGLGSPDLPSTIIQDIDLHLECDDDGNFCLPDVADSNSVPSHSVIGQNVNLSVTFPVPKQTEKTSSVFSCSQCDQTFSKNSKLAKHLLQVHEIVKNFQCTVCSFATTSTRLLRRHFVRMHEAKNREKFPKSRHQEQFKSDKIHVPVTPDNPTGNKNSQPKSSEVDEQTVCDAELQLFNEPKRTGLNVSKFIASDVDDRKEHQSVFMCSECPYKGISQKLLKMHFTNIHDQSRTVFNCDVCDFSCKQKRTFIIHERLHKGEKPFKCDFCQKYFSSMTTLKRHTLIHGTDRQHNCPFEDCSQAFKYKDILRSHISKVHKKGIGSDLNNGSEKQVSKYKADGSCKKTTLFVCSWKGCGKSFRDNYNLKCHYCLHTGEKPLKCPHCEFRCVQQASLNYHVKKMHFELKNS